MKKLFSKKAFTLVEVILAIAIIATIALPLMSVFLQSAKTQRAAQGVLSANYISQDYIERLDTTTYGDALASRPNRTNRNGYYLTAEITPYGTASSMFAGPCAYAQLVFYSTGGMLAVMPDGKYRMFASVPSSISISSGGGLYSFSGGGVTLSGGMGRAYCAVLINAMAKPSGSKCTVTLSANCKALRYCKKADKADIAISGAGETYCDMTAGDTSMIHVKTYVYETATAAEPMAAGEGYISIRNWQI
jgi:prepilin-type N-terminal cleavage/methylation domain